MLQMRACFKPGVYSAVPDDFKIFSTKPGGKRPLLRRALIRITPKFFLVALLIISWHLPFKSRFDVLAQTVDSDKELELQGLKVKERLFPVLRDSIDNLCGRNCPSFKIDPFFKFRDSLDTEELGFSVPAERSSSGEAREKNYHLNSVVVTILIHDQTPKSSQESFRKIIHYRLSNELHVPVQVKLSPVPITEPFPQVLKTEDGVSLNPLMTSQREQLQFQTFQRALWPVALFLIALTVFVGFVLFLRSRKVLLEKRLNAWTKNQDETLPVTSAKNPATNLDIAGLGEEDLQKLEAILSLRKEDLQWFIEDEALKKNKEGLRMILALFSSENISKNLLLSKSCISTLSSLPEQDKALDMKKAMSWLKDSLNTACWKRLEELHFPLRKLNKLPPQQLFRLFMKLPTARDQALLLMNTMSSRWAHLLGKVSSHRRIEIGLSLSQLMELSPHDLQNAKDILAQGLNEIFDTLIAPDQLANTLETEVLQDFSNFISDQEVLHLQKELAHKALAVHKDLVTLATFKDPMHFTTLEGLIEKLTPDEILNVVLLMDVKAIAPLLSQLTPKNKARILSVLPLGLRKRIDLGSIGTPENAATMKAKANFIASYRQSRHVEVDV